MRGRAPRKHPAPDRGRARLVQTARLPMCAGRRRAIAATRLTGVVAPWDRADISRSPHRVMPTATPADCETRADQASASSAQDLPIDTVSEEAEHPA